MKRYVDNNQHAQVIETVGKIVSQAPSANIVNATLYTQLCAHIHSRQFEQALAFLQAHKQLQTHQFEKAYILHRMGRN